MQIDCIRIIPTTKPEEQVKLVFSPITKTVNALLLDRQGNEKPIPAENTPRDFRQVESTLQFATLLNNDTFARVTTLSDGNRQLYLEQRLKGGGGGANAPVMDVEDPELPAKVMEIVNKEKDKLLKTHVKSNAVLLLGKTSAGKSMLGNLLSGVKIKGNPNGTLDAVDPIFAFSHSNTESCTGCPNAHSPKGQEHTILDFPGFDDTRGAPQDIANAFFRKEILAGTQNLKIVLTVNYNDIAIRGSNLRDTFHELFQFLGVEGDAKFANLAAATSLVVTRVPNNPNVDYVKEIETYLRNYCEETDTLSENGKSLLGHILRKKKWAPFTAASGSGETPKLEQERTAISDLVHAKAAYMSKSDTNLQVKVSQKYGLTIQSTLLHLAGTIKRKFADRLAKEMEKRIKNFYTGVVGAQAIMQFQEKFFAVISAKTPRTLAESFKELELGIGKIDVDLFSEALREDDSMKFLWELLPATATKNIPFRRDWIGELGLRETFMKWNELLVNMTKEAVITQIDKTVFLRGYFPSTGQLLKYVKGRTDVQEVQIQALHTVSIDESLESEVFAGINVSIIAPKWEIRNDRTINLSGKANTTTFSSRATDGSSWGDHGTDGSPGAPGGNAGHFFGIGLAFSGIDGLTINANGGQGGPGQVGGNGHRGANGADAHPKNDYEFIKSLRNEPTGWDHVQWPRDGNQNQLLKNDGKPGAVGGNAGRGGAGGTGGLPGSIEVFSLNKAITVKTSAQNGAAGNDGLAGGAGLGGLSGRDWSGVWHTGHGKNEWNKWHLPAFSGGGVVGTSGAAANGTNSTGRQAPSAQTPFNALMRLYYYREFAIAESNPFVIDAMEAFRQLYDNNASIQSKTTVDQLITECQLMEDFYTKMPDKAKCLPLYQWMKDRIQQFDAKGNAQNIALLQCLYTCTLSRIGQIQGSLESRLIIDVKGFLKVVEANIKALDKLDHNVLVRVYEKEYVTEINDKISEADVFLRKLRDDIRAADKEIVNQIKELVKEIEKLKKSNEGKKDELSKKKKELQDLIARRRLLGGLTMIIQGIGCCFPPAGPIVAGLASTGLSAIANPGSAAGLGGQALATYTETISNVLEGKVDSSGNKIKLSDAHNGALTRIRAATLVHAVLDASGETSKNEEEQIKAIDKAVAQIDKEQVLLDQYKDKVKDSFETTLHQFVDNAVDLQQALKGQSKIALDFSRLGVQRAFRNAREQVRDVTKGFATGAALETIIQQMEEAIDTSAKIYDHIQEYEERRRLVQYMARLASTSSIDPRIDKFLQMVQRNIVLEQYSRAVSAVRQWAFPFASLFLEDFTNLKPFLEKAKIDDFMDSVKRQLKLLKTKVDGSYSQISSAIHTFLWTGKFEGNTEKANGPFFVWDFANHQKEIRALLRGEEVTLFADVVKTKVEFSAIKFTEIELQIQTGDKLLKNDLAKALEGVRVKMTHSGTSFYRHDSQIYKMTNDQGFCLQYQIGEPGKPSPSSNAVYQKMNKGEFMLSPYTEWKFQLSNGNKLFQEFEHDLKSFKLALVGTGQYILTEKAKAMKWNLGYYSGNAAFGANPVPGSLGSGGFSYTPPPPRPPTDAGKPQNALGQKDNGQYLYQATDVHAIKRAPTLKREFANFVVIEGAQGTHIDRKIEEILAIVNTGKPVLCAFNLSNVHWVAFCLMKKPDNRLLLLYKDSFGLTDNDLYRTLKGLNLEFRNHPGAEQRGDGTSCGIFMIENMRIMARALDSPGSQQFINNFETQAFCTLDKARTLRQIDYPRFYQEGVREGERLEAEKASRAQTLAKEHAVEVDKIIAALQLVTVEPGITVQNKSTAPTATKTIVVQIGANDDTLTSYHYRIQATKDMNVSQLQLFLAQSNLNWYEGTHYEVVGNIIKVHAKIT